ncbi:hypothetical protein V8E36_003656 [Tilletia maclaganii]
MWLRGATLRPVGFVCFFVDLCERKEVSHCPSPDSTLFGNLVWNETQPSYGDRSTTQMLRQRLHEGTAARQDRVDSAVTALGSICAAWLVRPACERQERLSSSASALGALLGSLAFLENEDQDPEPVRPRPPRALRPTLAGPAAASFCRENSTQAGTSQATSKQHDIVSASSLKKLKKTRLIRIVTLGGIKHEPTAAKKVLLERLDKCMANQKVVLTIAHCKAFRTEVDDNDIRDIQPPRVIPFENQQGKISFNILAACDFVQAKA